MHVHTRFPCFIFAGMEGASIRSAPQRVTTKQGCVDFHSVDMFISIHGFIIIFFRLNDEAGHVT